MAFDAKPCKRLEAAWPDASKTNRQLQPTLTSSGPVISTVGPDDLSPSELQKLYFCRLLRAYSWSTIQGRSLQSQFFPSLCARSGEMEWISNHPSTSEFIGLPDIPKTREEVHTADNTVASCANRIVLLVFTALGLRIPVVRSGLGKVDMTGSPATAVHYSRWQGRGKDRLRFDADPVTLESHASASADDSPPSPVAVPPVRPAANSSCGIPPGPQKKKKLHDGCRASVGRRTESSSPGMRDLKKEPRFTSCGTATPRTCWRQGMGPGRPHPVPAGAQP